LLFFLYEGEGSSSKLIADAATLVGAWLEQGDMADYMPLKEAELIPQDTEGRLIYCCCCLLLHMDLHSRVFESTPCYSVCVMFSTKAKYLLSFSSTRFSMTMVYICMYVRVCVCRF
jgi:hypothetical protein